MLISVEQSIEGMRTKEETPHDQGQRDVPEQARRPV
jgi:hypothetical protein